MKNNNHDAGLFLNITVFEKLEIFIVQSHSHLLAMGKVAKLKKQHEVRPHILQTSAPALSRKLGKSKVVRLKQDKLRRLKSVATAKSVIDQADFKRENSAFRKARNATEPSQKSENNIISFVSLADDKGTGARKTKKKDKQKLRHNLLLRKLEEAEEAKQKNKDNKTNLLPDLNCIGAALPKLNDNSYQKKSKGAGSEKCKSTLKMRQRQKKFVNDVQMFKQIYKTREFQDDPLGAISQHLRNKLAENGL